MADDIRHLKNVMASADTGGTFTDVVTAQGRTAKVLTARESPVDSVEDGLMRTVGYTPIATLSHGTTVGTNALLERRGATTALVTNAGLADVIEIGRQTRPDLYDLFADRPDPLVPRHLRFEVPCRLDHRGNELLPLEEKSLQDLTRALLGAKEKVASVAVCLLHSYANPSQERRVGQVLKDYGLAVTLSSDTSPEFREYERTSTTVINAYLKPVLSRYLALLGRLAERAFVMTSSAALIPAERAAESAARLLLSGPAGGATAAAAAAAASGFPTAVTLDMGGTSADVCLVDGGVPEPSPQLSVGGLPVRVPAVDIVTIGAGGGSIAYLDPGGALQVGPRSAGADPGPACYGRGGEEATVTDANLVLGRIPRGHEFQDLGTLDDAAARESFRRLEVDPEDVVAVVNANMERALRKVTAERGYDPSRLALVAFGGAGPLHACELAEALGIPAVVVPPRAGVLSAVGLLVAPVRHEAVRSRTDPRCLEGLEDEAESLLAEATGVLRKWGFEPAGAEVFYDCRYVGQSHELTCKSVEHFHQVHLLRNGYSRPDAPVEVTAIRARVWAEAPATYEELVTSYRSPGRVVGPECIAEEDCTIFVKEGWVAEVDSAGSWVMRPAP